MSTASGAQTLILFVVMTLVTLWFSNLVLRAVDILYEPRVRGWMKRPRASLSLSPREPLAGKAVRDDAEYIKALEKELIRLRAMWSKEIPVKSVVREEEVTRDSEAVEENQSTFEDQVGDAGCPFDTNKWSLSWYLGEPSNGEDSYCPK